MARSIVSVEARHRRRIASGREVDADRDGTNR
jgi:hypothetical protein